MKSQNPACIPSRLKFDDAIRGIQAHTLVVVGDRDVIRPEHALELSKLLPHARLCILPGTHGSYLGEIMTPEVSDRTVRIFADLVNEFLERDARQEREHG